MDDNKILDGVVMSFRAIDQVAESNIITPTEKEQRGKELIEYGDGNIYPQYIFDLFETVPTLRACALQMADYICGENISINDARFAVKVNEDGDTIEDLCKQIGLDLATYGGFAISVIRNRAGEISQLYNIDFKCIRSDKKNKRFYYSEKWKDSRAKYIEYPAFDPNENQSASIVYYKSIKYRTYPTPMWAAATKSAEIEKLIGEYHLNNLHNGFAGSYILNLNNGQPTPAQKEEIENNFNEKFCGVENAGRFVISYNKGKDAEATIAPIPSTDFADKYNALKKDSRDELFTAFRTSPVLLGIRTENNGFSNEDFQEEYKLYNKTVVLPAQKAIKRVFENIFGIKNVLVIEPFDVTFGEGVHNNNPEEVVE